MVPSPIRLLFNVVRRFNAEHYAQTAAALSFVTLLGLVPMVVVGAALIEWLPFGVKLSSALEQFLLTTLLPEKAGKVIARYLGEFAQRAGRMTWIGLAFLGLTALVQMLTIERSFAAIWKVRRPRPLYRRLGLHLLTLLIGPLVFGGALASTTYLATVSFGWVDEPRWLRLAVYETLPIVFLAGLFGMLYWALPNRAVSGWHAGLSGVLTALAFVGMQRLFALYIARLPTYTLIYGAFAVIPIFLLWLYLSWTVIIVGALFTAELPKSSYHKP
ncbi:MAG: YihY family inner membrane protein [Rhodocyclaceae bacterium]